MKSCKEIIQSIQNDPLYAEIDELKTIFEVLPSTHRELIAFMYRKDSDLFIACKHNVGLLELKRDNNIKLIKNTLKMYCSHYKNSNLRLITDVKIFVSKKFYKQILAKRLKEKEKIEEAKMMQNVLKEVRKRNYDLNFAINVKDENLRKIFEDIRRNLLAIR